MALRTKTIEYAFDTRTTTLAAAARHDAAAITVYAPENTGRTFRSVIVQVTLHDAQAATASRASLSSWLIGIKLGAVAFDDVTVTDTMTDTGEQVSYLFTRDVTAYFSGANFGSGTSQTCQVGVQFGTSSATNPFIAQNISIKLIVTYEYNDDSGTGDNSQVTRVKTVRIPLESNTTVLTAVLASIGSSQIPALDTFLPESSKVYRSIFFECQWNEATTVATDYTSGLALDAEAEAASGTVEQANISSRWRHYIWRRDDMDTSATHDFKARNSVASLSCWLSVVLVVTYEYDHSASTRIMNSVMLPWDISTPVGTTTTADATRFARKVRIMEPGVITLVQSGFLMTFNAAAASNITCRAGAQTYRTHTHVAGTTTCGQYCLMRRIDSGATGGAGITLARGENDLTIDVYASSAANVVSNAGGLVYLNYTSDKHASGDGVHMHTTAWSVRNTAADEALLTISAPNRVPNIPEALYWLSGVGYVVNFSVTTAAMAISMAMEMGSGEGDGDGWEQIYSDAYVSDNEGPALSTAFVAARTFFDRYPGDFDAQADIETSRRYRIYTTTSSWKSVMQYVTYHAITFAAAGTVSGYTGDGSGITVNIHRADTGEKLATGTTAIGGTYSVPVYDGVSDLFTEAYQDGTHVGRSANYQAT